MLMICVNFSHIVTHFLGLWKWQKDYYWQEMACGWVAYCVTVCLWRTQPNAGEAELVR